MNKFFGAALFSTAVLVSGCTSVSQTVDNMSSHDGSLFMTVNKNTYQQGLYGPSLIHSERKVVRCDEQSRVSYSCQSVDIVVDGEPVFQDY